MFPQIKMVRKYIEKMYDSTCSIKHQEHWEDYYGIAHERDIAVATNEPCRVSYSSFPVASGTDTVTNTGQEIKLFIRPDIAIVAGSKVEVTHIDGQIKIYDASGVPAVYHSHQEIMLKLKERYA